MSDPGLRSRFRECGIGDVEFAGMLDDLGAEAFRQGNLADAEYFWDAADLWADPSSGTVAARMLLMTCAMERRENDNGL